MLPVSNSTKPDLKQARAFRRALKVHADKCGHLIDSHYTCRQSTRDPMLWCIGCLCRAALNEPVPQTVYLMNVKEWESRVHSAFRFLEQQGYRYCDTRACNCGSWHKW